MADYAAYTGSITVKSARIRTFGQPAPTVLIAIIPIERMVTRLGEILVQFDQAGRGGAGGNPFHLGPEPFRRYRERSYDWRSRARHRVRPAGRFL